MEKIGILGSTGSIGISSLDVVSRFPERFKISFLSTNSNIELLSDQAKRFKPEAVCVVDRRKAGEFKKRWHRIKMYEGEEGLCEAIEKINIDALLVAIVGASALLPIMKGLHRVKKIALANKEALVMAGNVIINKALQKKVKIMPIDSEHSAIFQCIGERDRQEVKRIFLTGSGGPLLNVPGSRFKAISVKQAISHPKWKMGKKISVDSATMMNKGLEVIEARWLFGVDVDSIEVFIHPETIVHSMVEFIDGSILAQLGICDMRVPIQYALTYPVRSGSGIKGLEFSKVKNLNFYKPDFKRFPCLALAYEAGKMGGTYPCVLNASNEIAVNEFIRGRIRFTDIPRLVEKVLGSHKGVKNPGLDDIIEADRWARARTLEWL